MIGRRKFGIAGASALLFDHARGQTSGSAALHNDRPKPELYFYPNAYRLSNGAIMYHPIAVEPEPCTTLFPVVAEMSGLVALPYWSQLSHQPGQLDLSLLHHIVDYWRGLSRKVVLGVITVGYPLRTSPTKIIGATPGWLMSRIVTYEQDVRLLGNVKPLEQVNLPFSFASYWDSSFLEGVQEMVTALAREFDGDPSVSRIRIATGITAEDNPTFDGLRSAMPGFTNMRWIKYCDAMLEIYAWSFRSTQLEFDIDRLGWIVATGKPNEQAAATNLVLKLLRNNVFLAMDGFDTKNASLWRDQSNSGPEKSIDFMMLASRERAPFGLEGVGANRLSSNDVVFQANIFRQLGASRLVLFSDGAAALSLVRHGPSAATAAHADLLGIPKLEATAKVMQLLLNRSGVG